MWVRSPGVGWGGGKATLDSCPPHLHHGESISPSASVLWSCNKALFVHLYFRAKLWFFHRCESWTAKKAERRRIAALELWCWRRLLWVPWTARRSNQSLLKEISPGCSLEGLMLNLELQYFGHLMRRADSLEKTLMLGGIGGRRRRGRQRMRWLDGISDSMDIVVATRSGKQTPSEGQCR